MELEKEAGNKDFSVVNISGNEKITFTYRDAVGATSVSKGTEITRDTEVSGIMNNEIQYQDRINVEVMVSDINEVYRSFKERDILIDHLYDY